MATKTQSTNWLQNILFILFFLSLATGGIFAYEIIYPHPHDAKITFTLGVDKSLPYKKQKEIANENLKLLTSREVLEPVISSYIRDKKKEKTLSDFIDQNLRINYTLYEVSLNVLNDNPLNAKDMAEDIFSSFQNQLEIYRKEKKQKLAVLIAHLDKEISLLKADMVSKPLKNTKLQKKETQKLKGSAALNLGKARIISRYIDTYVELIQKEAILRFINDTATHRDDYAAMPETTSTQDLRALIRSANSLKVNIKRLEETSPKNTQQLKDMRFEYFTLNKQIDAEISRIIHQLKNQISIDKLVIAELEKKIDDANLIASPDSQKAQENNDNNASEFRLKLQETIRKREILNAESESLSRGDNNIVITAQAKIMPTNRHLAAKKYLFFTSLALFLFFSGLLITLWFMDIDDKERLTYNDDTIKRDLFRTSRAQPKIILRADLLKRIFLVPIKRVAIFGYKAEHEAAGLILEYVKSGKKAILVDFSGKEINNYIGKHLGIVDILLNVCSLEKALYRDPNIGVDVLSKGENKPFFQDEELGRLEVILSRLESYYDLVVLAISEEPFASLQYFLNNRTDIVISPCAKDYQETNLWITTLQLSGFEDLFLLKDKR